jgi:hypothetical protein
MYLSDYLSRILINFNDNRTVRNIKNLVRKVIEHKSIQIWTISDDKAEFKRSRRLIDNSRKTVLDEEKVSESLRDQGTSALADESYVIVIHDPCDIRKEFSVNLENLGTVRSLDGDLINGYNTFNSVAMNPKGKKIYPIDTSTFSNGDPNYTTEEELDEFSKGTLQESENPEVQERATAIQAILEDDNDVNLRRIAFGQLRRVSDHFKSDNPDITLTHVFDRQFDANDYFSFIDGVLDDQFVIRLKISRNSNETEVAESGKESSIKLEDVSFANKDVFYLDTLIINKTVYQQAKCVIEHDTVTVNGEVYTVVRVTLLDRKGKMIFEHPMLLITNISVKTSEQAREIYRIYLKRSKIEAVFKFLKSVLGWEEFQVEDYISIKNIIALCYFIGAYFYEIESELTDNRTVAFICKLGGGKGKVTRHFFLQGLQKLLTYQSVQRFVNDQDITQHLWEDMIRFVELN